MFIEQKYFKEYLNHGCDGDCKAYYIMYEMLKYVLQSHGGNPRTMMGLFGASYNLTYENTL